MPRIGGWGRVAFGQDGRGSMTEHGRGASGIVWYGAIGKADAPAFERRRRKLKWHLTVRRYMRRGAQSRRQASCKPGRSSQQREIRSIICIPISNGTTTSAEKRTAKIRRAR